MPISSVLLNFLILAGIGYFFRRRSISFPKVALFSKIILFLALAWLVLSAAAYPFTVPFIDHAEASVATVAAHWLNGHSLYTTLDSSERYSLLYGPWPYLVSALSQSFGAMNLFLAKIPGVLNLILTLAGLAILLNRRSLTRQEVGIALGVVSLGLLGFYNISYWGRPDSYLMMTVFLALVLAESHGRFSNWTIYLGFAFLAGIATGCKLHGGIYFVPVAIYFLESKKEKLDLAKLLVAVAVFIIAAAMPFLLPQVSAGNYFSWLEMASKHELIFKDFVKNFTFVLTYLVLLKIFGFDRKFKWSFWSLAVVCLLVAAISSKAGAGPHHFLPLVPMMVWWALREYFNLSDADKKSFSFVVASFVLAIGLHAFNRQKSVYKYFMQAKQGWSEFADLKSIANKYPGKIEMGYGDIQTYPDTFYKAWLVHAGHGLVLDGASLMDAHASGMTLPPQTVELFSTCQISTVVIPKGSQPWSILSFYGDVPLFDETFKSAFSSRYQLVETVGHYDVYTCN